MKFLRNLWRRISSLWTTPEKPSIPNDGLAHKVYPPFVIAPFYGLGYIEPPYAGQNLLEVNGHLYKLRHHVMRNGACRFVDEIEPDDFVFDADWLENSNTSPAE